MRIDALTLKQLRALLAVQKTGSLTLAAERLNQTPPAIHSQIKTLEGVVGHAVLQRATDGTGFRVTAVGQELLNAARRIEANLSQADRQIAAVTQGKTGQVVLGTVSTAKYFAPRLVRLLQDRLPDIEVSLRVANRGETIAALEHGEYDLAIMGRPPQQMIAQAIPLGPHPHGIVLRPDHPMAEKEGYDPAQLLQETFLSREEGSGTRVLMERFIDRLAEGQVPRKVVMQSNETIKQAILAGLGIGFLSLHTVHDELTAGRLTLLKGPDLPMMRHWYLINQMDDIAPSHVTQSCVEAIEALAGVYLPQITV